MTLQKHLQDAVAAHRRGDLDTAASGYRAILRAQPHHFDATHLLGAALAARGKNKEAETILRRAAALNPNVAAVQNNLANTVKAQGRIEESLEYYDRAIVLDPNYADAFNNRGNVHLELGHTEKALSDYECALTLNPNYANALQKSAKIFADMQRYEEALVRNDRALALESNSVDAWLRSGNVLIHLKRPRDALASYDKALALDPNNMDALINRSAALEGLGRPQEALVDLGRVLATQPDNPGALNNMGTILKSLGRIDEACAAYQRSLAIAPNDAETRTNYAMALFLRGDLSGGWREYEVRWQKKANIGKYPPITFPTWKGEPLDGRSIIVFAEQGLGDIVQFSRYLPLLQQRGASVTFLVTRRMHAILGASFPGVALSSEVTDVAKQPFDFQIAMMSLPLRFDTRLDSVPLTVPYLKPDSERVRRWRERVGTHGFRVGVCWQGNPDVAIDFGRSIPLSAFAPLAAVPGVRLISLQKNAGSEQIEGCDFDIGTLGANFDSGSDAFVDTLAVMENLDLVISPDTSIAHVAGALGRPSWVALKFAPDWRWMMEGHETPWYPSMRLFRQTQAGDWQGVFSRMGSALTLA